MILFRGAAPQQWGLCNSTSLSVKPLLSHCMLEHGHYSNIMPGWRAARGYQCLGNAGEPAPDVEGGPPAKCSIDIVWGYMHALHVSFATSDW